jgi:hypothetical protein
MPEPQSLYLYGGSHATVGDARSDLDHLRELHSCKHIGHRDAVASAGATMDRSA